MKIASDWLLMLFNKAGKFTWEGSECRAVHDFAALEGGKHLDEGDMVVCANACWVDVEGTFIRCNEGVHIREVFVHVEQTFTVGKEIDGVQARSVF